MSSRPSVRSRMQQEAGPLRRWLWELQESAQRLASSIEQHFWCEALGTYGIAIDGAGECAAPACRMQATCCLQVSYRKSGRNAWRPA